MTFCRLIEWIIFADIEITTLLAWHVLMVRRGQLNCPWTTQEYLCFPGVGWLRTIFCHWVTHLAALVTTSKFQGGCDHWPDAFMVDGRLLNRCSVWRGCKPLPCMETFLCLWLKCLVVHRGMQKLSEPTLTILLLLGWGYYWLSIISYTSASIHWD